MPDTTVQKVKNAEVQPAGYTPMKRLPPAFSIGAVHKAVISLGMKEGKND